MERVHLTADNPVEAVDAIAIAVYQNRGHIGILYWTEPDAEQPAVGLMHWGWHDLWGTIAPDECAFWISPNIDTVQKDLVAGICRLVESRNAGGKLTFGFAPPWSLFDTDVKLVPQMAEIGVTCASFVLGIFHRSGVPLIQYETWKAREEDTPRLIELVNLYRRTPGVTETQVEDRLRAIVQNQVRYRPLEVAGAAWLGSLPVNFETAITTADAIAAEFTRLSKQ